MAWTTQEMQELGTARTSINKLNGLIEQLETLDEAVYNVVVADDGVIGGWNYSLGLTKFLFCYSSFPIIDRDLHLFLFRPGRSAGCVPITQQ